jgi:hypothetical protein
MICPSMRITTGMTHWVRSGRRSSFIGLTSSLPRCGKEDATRRRDRNRGGTPGVSWIYQLERAIRIGPDRILDTRRELLIAIALWSALPGSEANALGSYLRGPWFTTSEIGSPARTYGLEPEIRFGRLRIVIKMCAAAFRALVVRGTTQRARPADRSSRRSGCTRA